MAGKRGTCTLARASAFALSLVFFASSPSSPTQGQSSVTMTADEAKAVQVVEGYVGETHKWPRDSYRVELKFRDGDTLTFWVLHKDDETTRRGSNVAGGGGKSFEIDVNAKRLRVGRELGFQ
jgi:hypothetical protein